MDRPAGSRLQGEGAPRALADEAERRDPLETTDRDPGHHCGREPAREAPSRRGWSPVELVPGEPAEPEERGHQAQVGRAGQELADDGQRHRERGQGGRVEPQRYKRRQHPGHPGRARIVVEEARCRKERAGDREDPARDGRGLHGQPQSAREEDRAEPCKNGMAHDEQPIVVGRRDEENQPRGWVEQLEVRVREERCSEAHVRVPQGQIPGADRTHEDVDVGKPVGEDVALEEDEIAGQRAPERRDDAREHQEGRRAERRSRIGSRGAHGVGEAFTATSL